MACLGALEIPREACRAFALRYSWENSARQFIGHVRKVAIRGAEATTLPSRLPRPRAAEDGAVHFTGTLQRCCCGHTKQEARR